MTQSTLFLSSSPRLRYFTGATAYFTQGIPMGLLHIALPAWLAAQGASPAQIAGYLAVIALPWAMKLLTGPLMDHFEFLPMGKRRPWVLGAQFGLVISFLALGLVDDPISQISLLSAIGFLINAFTATQDVAVDGMAIELVPVEEEGRLNAFMSFGKAAGWAITSAITGTLLVVYGIQFTGVACSIATLVLFVFLFAVREREGERLFPWSAGEASPLNEPPPSFRKVFSDINHIIWSRTSLIIMAIMLVNGLNSGYGRALMPIAAVQVFGFTTPQWSELNAIMGLIGALLALAIGPVIDKFGAKRIMWFGMLLTGVHAFALAATEAMWGNNSYVLAMISAWIVLLPMIMVSVLALAMSICSPGESATQFAIYMSVANIGGVLGSALYGLASEQFDWAQNYALKGFIAVLVLLAVMMFRSHGHPQELLSDNNALHKHVHR